jgi:hypothetical protein
MSRDISASAKQAGSGRGAKDDIDTVMCSLLNGIVQPTEGEVAFFRLQCAPGKLAEPDEPDASVLHQRKIGFPARLRPLFRVPSRAQVKSSRTKPAVKCNLGYRWLNYRNDSQQR